MREKALHLESKDHPYLNKPWLTPKHLELYLCSFLGTVLPMRREGMRIKANNTTETTWQAILS